MEHEHSETKGQNKMNNTAKKITRATFKSFIKNNADNLFVLEQSRFDGMVDCVTSVQCAPVKVEPAKINFEISHDFGINGVWLVGGSRDYFYAYEDEMFRGFRVSNSCGAYIVATIK